MMVRTTCPKQEELFELSAVPPSPSLTIGLSPFGRRNMVHAGLGTRSDNGDEYSRGT